MLKLRCPKCKNTMLCQPSGEKLDKKVKRCVYCGHTFSVHKNILQAASSA